jgi:hypothetical protein
MDLFSEKAVLGNHREKCLAKSAKEGTATRRFRWIRGLA